MPFCSSAAILRHSFEWLLLRLGCAAFKFNNLGFVVFGLLMHVKTCVLYCCIHRAKRDRNVSRAIHVISCWEQISITWLLSRFQIRKQKQQQPKTHLLFFVEFQWKTNKSIRSFMTTIALNSISFLSPPLPQTKCLGCHIAQNYPTKK